jgi:hypothetical protein
LLRTRHWGPQPSPFKGLLITYLTYLILPDFTVLTYSVPDPWHFGVDLDHFDPDPQIHASDRWIRILLFSSLTWRCQQKTNFLTQFFSACNFLKVHLHHFLKIKSQIVGLKIFFIIFTWWSKGPDSEPDPDP